MVREDRRDTLALAVAVGATNLRRDWLSPAPLVTGMLMSAASNTLFVLFWALFFHRFSAVNGFRAEDVFSLWATTTVGFGLTFLVFGNLQSLPRLIVDGGLDSFLLLPRKPLLLTLTSATGTTYAADVLFGLAAYVVLVPLSPGGLVRYLVAVAVVVAVVTGFLLCLGALAFWAAEAETVGGQLVMSLVQLGTFPGTVFHGLARVAVFTVVPAAFINLAPVHLLREPRADFLLASVAAAAGWCLLGRWLFYRGLRRYEAGSVGRPTL